MLAAVKRAHEIIKVNELNERRIRESRKLVREKLLMEWVTQGLKFKNDSGNYKSAYIYKKDNQYYIEQPYNGIYQVTEDEYTRIEKVVK